MKILKSKAQIQGNIAVNACVACCKSAKLNGRRVTEIRLSALWWVLFADAMKQMAPEISVHEDGVDFNGTKIRRGSKLQKERMEFDLTAPKLISI